MGKDTNEIPGKGLHWATQKMGRVSHADASVTSLAEEFDCR